MKIQIEEEKFGMLTVRKGKTKKTSSSRGFACSRNVYIFDKFVVKFDSGADEYNQNSHELFFYEHTLQAEDKKHFAKLLGKGMHNGRLFLVQERVFDNGGSITSKQHQKFEELEQKYSLQDIDFFDYVRRNCVLTGRGVKIFDVGVVDNELFLEDNSDCSCCS